MSDAIDRNFRPKSYFSPQPLEDYLLSRVKGAVLRNQLREEGGGEAGEVVRDAILRNAIPKGAIRALETMHPMFMGGNYLPDMDEGEVEIGRIVIESVTSDVTCVYARKVDGKIRYRVVDEYDGDTLQGETEAESEQPMTLAEFVDFFLQAWSLLDVLDCNFEGDLERSLAFFRAESDFYPDFDRECRARVRDRFPESEPEESEDG